MEIKKPERRRRNHTEAFKQAVITACCEPGASVAGISLANKINANQVRRWMRERGVATEGARSPAQTVALERVNSAGFLPVPIPPPAPESHEIRIEVRRGNTAVKIEWPTQAADECAAWLRDWLR